MSKFSILFVIFTGMIMNNSFAYTKAALRFQDKKTLIKVKRDTFIKQFWL